MFCNVIDEISYKSMEMYCRRFIAVDIFYIIKRGQYSRFLCNFFSF